MTISVKQKAEDSMFDFFEEKGKPQCEDCLETIADTLDEFICWSECGACLRCGNIRWQHDYRSMFL